MAEINEVVAVERIDHVLVVTIRRPEALNAVNAAVSTGVARAMELSESDVDIRAVVITGAGERAFCVGADLKALSAGASVLPDDPGLERWGFGGCTGRYGTKPLIAAVNGLALGGGLEICLMADVIVADERASFALPEVTRGIIAAMGGVVRLSERLPQTVAWEMILSGESIDAARAHQLGLVSRLAPAGSVREVALEVAAAISRAAPLAVQASKRIARGIVDGAVAAESGPLALSDAEHQRVLETEDSREGPRAFVERRPPSWSAR
ncbi:enoyl-CoA hydratase-related protein [Microbacterium sp. SORGH_AS_0888]|uniref:enoyl-CoA hydratase-related protein n=1 Tax=Microbacterium sp. SORGH_AS_0888 TaxID=3041791 RepID=UPI002789FBFB|nr:enoyl-CoA hydratase-related protein [Microbacterium sp. SORGH_AS_0888]MDQ1131016.1 crotonobetainyl-CoA hydratase [Microbacterium sp. SORGH_AS_0888]